MAALSLPYVLLFVAAILIYVVGLVVYRLYFHPLSHIPGPKIAAATQWTETYYECFKKPGGVFMWEIMKWHEQYGPVVRIAPNEVHISDSTYYDVLYSQSRHSDKLDYLRSRFNNDLSAFATPEHDIHRMRRGALNPFFSKSKISKYSPEIQKHMDRLCNRVAEEYAGTDKVIILNRMWGALTADIIVGYCCEKSYDFIMRPDFRAEFSDTFVDLLEPVHFVTQFSWMMKGMQMLPDWLVVKLNPGMKSIFHFMYEMRDQILHAKALKASGDEKIDSAKDAHTSLFTSLLESDLPPSELGTLRMQHEMMSLVGAGFETTMYSLSVASYHLLANPNLLTRLRAELTEAIVDPKQVPHLDTLMQLPYLTCVINETLRFSYGVSQRIPRLSPTPLVYTLSSGEEIVIPVGAIASMDNVTVSMDPTIFVNPQEFQPARWEGNPMAPDGKALKNYLVPFGKGTRSCLGIQVAYADLYIALATWYRRFECELYETERDAVDVYMDRFVPRPAPETKGVRIKVLRDLAA